MKEGDLTRLAGIYYEDMEIRNRAEYIFQKQGGILSLIYDRNQLSSTYERIYKSAIENTPLANWIPMSNRHERFQFIKYSCNFVAGIWILSFMLSISSGATLTACFVGSISLGGLVAFCFAMIFQKVIQKIEIERRKAEIAVIMSILANQNSLRP